MAWYRALRTHSTIHRVLMSTFSLLSTLTKGPVFQGSGTVAIRIKGLMYFPMSSLRRRHSSLSYAFPDAFKNTYLLPRPLFFFFWWGAVSSKDTVLLWNDTCFICPYIALRCPSMFLHSWYSWDLMDKSISTLAIHFIILWLSVVALKWLSDICPQCPSSF